VHGAALTHPRATAGNVLAMLPSRGSGRVPRSDHAHSQRQESKGNCAQATTAIAELCSLEVVELKTTEGARFLRQRATPIVVRNTMSTLVRCAKSAAALRNGSRRRCESRNRLDLCTAAARTSSAAVSRVNVGHVCDRHNSRLLGYNQARSSTAAWPASLHSHMTVGLAEQRWRATQAPCRQRHVLSGHAQYP
jgi:hypothetical protein